MQNGVSSYFYEGELQAKKKSEEEKRERRKERKSRKKKKRRVSLDPGMSGLSHFEGDFLKF